MRLDMVVARILTHIFPLYSFLRINILLSPSRTGLQVMVKICKNFAKATKLKFSTNIQIEKCKTKCLIFSKERVNYNEITPNFIE